MWQNLGSLLESEAHKECKYDTNRGGASGVKLTKDSMNKYQKPLPPSNPSLQKKRKKKINFVWWLSTLFVCKEINFDRFPSGDISFFCCVVHVHLCVILSVVTLCPKRKCPIYTEFRPQKCYFWHSQNFGDENYWTNFIHSKWTFKQKLCIKIFLPLSWYPWPQMKPN